MMSESDVSSQTKIRDLTQENTALQLRLTALQGESTDAAEWLKLLNTFHTQNYVRN